MRRDERCEMIIERGDMRETTDKRGEMGDKRGAIREERREREKEMREEI